MINDISKQIHIIHASGLSILGLHSRYITSNKPRAYTNYVNTFKHESNYTPPHLLPIRHCSNIIK